MGIKLNFTIIQAFNKYHALLGNVFREQRERKTEYEQERTGFIYLKEEQSEYLEKHFSAKRFCTDAFLELFALRL